MSAQIGIGSYSLEEAAKLIAVRPSRLRRWVSGYAYDRNAGRISQPPLWHTQHAGEQTTLLGFRDLIEARFVAGFVELGLSPFGVRRLMERARELIKDERPFSTSAFRSDGRTIFLETVNEAGEKALIDLKDGQRGFHRIIEPSFKDLDFTDGAVSRWHVLGANNPILVDPEVAFGQPTLAGTGVPTSRIAQAVEAEGNAARVAKQFEISTSYVRQAVAFEKRLQARA